MFSSSNLYRNLVRNAVILAVAICVVSLTYAAKRVIPAGAATASNNENPYIAFMLKNKKLSGMIDFYHDDMNKLFNERIKKAVLAIKQGGGDPKKLSALFAPPDFNMENGIPTTRKPCVNNLSTYCLAMDATGKYFQFRDALLSSRNDVQQIAGNVYQKLEGGAIAEDDINGAQSNLLDLGQAFEQMDREAEISRQTLDQALAAYNELQVDLPLHDKYMKVVKSLEAYRKKVSDLRRKIEQFPSTFLDVTTTQCT